jgi:hypothetical protein
MDEYRADICRGATHRFAHCSVRELGSTESSTNNLIAIDRAKQAQPDYLALGDWHATNQNQRPTWYSGTPEPDGFNLGGEGGGQVLLVDLEGDAPAQVTRPAASRFQ